jgi:hypothetical protein
LVFSWLLPLLTSHQLKGGKGQLGQLQLHLHLPPTPTLATTATNITNIIGTSSESVTLLISLNTKMLTSKILQHRKTWSMNIMIQNELACLIHP